MISAVLYRPLAFWADNAWSLSAPQEIIPTVMIQLALMLTLFAFGARLTGRITESALVVVAAAIAIFNWQAINTPTTFVVFFGVAVLAMALAIRAGSDGERHLSILLVGLLLGIPTVQLVLAHIQERAPYPLLVSEASPVAGATGQIQDVLILIVDGYPMPAIARSWFGHDTTVLKEALEARNFAVPQVSWSHNTFTSLALPSILEMRQVVDEAPKGHWGNQKPSYDIIRSHSHVVESFESAGFRYTHIESGWNGDSCGLIPRCLATSWPDEANWQLLRTSAIAPILKNRWGSPNWPNTMTTFSHLMSSEVFHTGADLVYAHLMLPHPPFIVDDQCNFVPIAHGDDPEDPRAIPDQLQCVDSLLIALVSELPRETTVILAGDHGTSTRGQLSRPGEEWTDADVAERLGALLAYRLPSSCMPPDTETNVLTMRAVASCGLDLTLHVGEIEFMIGLEDPVEVGPERIERITRRIEESELRND